jgi:hypothetical protein
MANQSTSDWPARLAPRGTFVGRVDEAGLLADLPVLLARDPFVVAVLRPGGGGLVTFLVYPPDDLVLVVKLQWPWRVSNTWLSWAALCHRARACADWLGGHNVL